MNRIKSYLNYTTKAGDTFDSLALAVYNNEKSASKIIDFNPEFSDVIIFEENIHLRIPVFDSVDTPSTLPPWRTDE